MSTPTSGETTRSGSGRSSTRALVRQLRQRLLRLTGREGSAREEGAGILDTIVVVPLLVSVALLIVGLARVRLSDGLVVNAANDAARAASLARSEPAARSAAQDAAALSLAAAGTACQGGPSVQVDTGAWRSGGSVSVTVACTAALADLAVPGLPGSHTLEGHAIAPLERFRHVGTT